MAPDPWGQLTFAQVASVDGYQVVSMAGELDIATAEQAFTYIRDVIDHGRSPVRVDLAGLTFCDASGLGVLARVANYASAGGRQLMVTSARPSLLKIMRITGMDRVFPEVGSPAVRAS
jgi:anti-sigma B factor antagonist